MHSYSFKGQKKNEGEEKETEKGQFRIDENRKVQVSPSQEIRVSWRRYHSLLLIKKKLF